MFKHKKLLFMGVVSALFSHSTQCGITNSINRKNLTLLTGALLAGEAAIAPMILLASSQNKPLLKKAKEELMNSRHSVERLLKSKLVDNQQTMQLINDIKPKLMNFISQFKAISSSKSASYFYKKAIKKAMKIFVNIVDRNLERVIKGMSH